MTLFQPREYENKAAAFFVEVPPGVKPSPSRQATADDMAWGWVPTMWHAMADPGGSCLWPGRSEDSWDDISRWVPAVHMLVYSLGWPRVDLGLLRWIGAGRPSLDHRLALLDAMLGEKVIELAAWFSTSHWAVTLMQEIARATRSTLDLSGWRVRDENIPGTSSHGPFRSGDGDALHLSGHVPCAVRPYAGDVHPVLLRDDTNLKACLLVDAYEGWYRVLARATAALGPIRSRWQWAVDVVCRPVGHLGTYRRCRHSGRWFAGDHGLHLMGAVSADQPSTLRTQPGAETLYEEEPWHLQAGAAQLQSFLSACQLAH